MSVSLPRAVFWLAIILTGLLLVHLLKAVLAPFVIAALFAYLGDPVTDRLEERGLSRTLAVCVVFAIMTLLVLVFALLLVPMIGAQLALLRDVIPTYLQWIQSQALPALQMLLGVDETAQLFQRVQQALQENWQHAGDFVAQLIAGITRSSLAILGWLGMVALIPVVTFYMLRDWDNFLEHIYQLLPLESRDTFAYLAKECDLVLGAFLRGQLLIMLLLGAIYATGLAIIGLDLALLLGMLAGLASIVPYLGIIVGILSSGIAAVVQFQDIIYLLPVLLVFGVGQMLEGMFLTPVLVGDKIGMHPVAVIFAVLAGAQLFGFVGMLLALPVAAVLMVLLRHLHHNYRSSVFYQGEQGEQGELLLAGGGAVPVAEAAADDAADELADDSASDQAPQQGESTASEQAPDKEH